MTVALSLLQGGNVLLTFKSNCSCDVHLQFALFYNPNTFTCCRTSTLGWSVMTNDPHSAKTTDPEPKICTVKHVKGETN